MAEINTVAFQDQVVRVELPVSSNVCREAQRICVDTARYCMAHGGEYVADEYIRLLLDTAALCHTVMDTTCRATWLHAHATSTCAALCDQVVAACERFPQDRQMMRCAAICRQCLDYCNQGNTITAA